MKYIIIFLILILIFLIFFIKNIKFNLIYSFLVYFFNFKINIINKENLKYMNERVIIMANHSSTIDFFILNYMNNTKKCLYTVSNINNTSNNSTSFFSKLFFNIKNYLESNKYLNLINYDAGNKESGIFVKENIVKHINNNNLVLLFPEGKTSRLGISKEFKPGSFKICSDNKIKILPITIYYNKSLGYIYKKSYSLENWFNTKIDIIIHEPIYNEDPIILQKLTYNTIVNPLIKKYKERNIIN